MKSSFHHSRTVTARKRHPCFVCWQPIPIGAPYVRSVGVWEGDFSSAAKHPVCERFLDDVLEPFETYGPGEFGVGQVAAWLQEPKQAGDLADARIYFSAHGSPRWREALGLEQLTETPA